MVPNYERWEAPLYGVGLEVYGWGPQDGRAWGRRSGIPAVRAFFRVVLGSASAYKEWARV